jgi:hypothetical protein
MLNIIHEYTRECLAIHVGRKIKAPEVLYHLSDEKGKLTLHWYNILGAGQFPETIHSELFEYFVSCCIHGQRPLTVTEDYSAAW